MQRQKFLKIGMDACDDAAWVWKKFWVVLWTQLVERREDRKRNTHS
jgi:hypothetical protein